MNLIYSLLLSFALFTTIFAQESTNPNGVKLDYQSDVARLRKIVINSLYSQRDVWLRELLSNANDAMEKLRLTALTNKDVWDNSSPLNITIKAIKDHDGMGGRIIVTDTGIGMNKDELAANLGTLAKSGTSEFLAQAESSDSTGTGNLIGAFGVGFYSSFLVADRVYVSSCPPKSIQDPVPMQYVFSSTAEDTSFELYPDPRGNTLGRGTEITLILKNDALEYLDTQKLSDLVAKHSSFSSTFPIYLFTQRTEEVPDDEVPAQTTEDVENVEEPLEVEVDEEAAIVEEVVTDADKPVEPEGPKMKNVTVDEWVQLNPFPPIWMRDPKDVTDEEYELFYQATFKDNEKPAAWQAFSGDSAGASFRGILYIPSHLPPGYFISQKIIEPDVRLMVKHVFITSDFGDDQVPKWANWVKVVVDAEDLPLNVSRETLQSTRFLRQIKHVILKHLIQLFSKLAAEGPTKFDGIRAFYNHAFKAGAVEDSKNREKLVPLASFNSTLRENITLQEYIENKQKGQDQIFYIADIGKNKEQLSKSVFIETLVARGYEVLLMPEPLDEILVSNLKQWQSLPFQDAARSGLKFGDEDLEDEDDTERQKELEAKFEPLVTWLTNEAQDRIRSVVLSKRLVTSSCAIVANFWGFTANVEKLMNAAHQQEKTHAHEFIRKQKILEINPNSPLIEGLLQRVNQLPTEEEGRDTEAEDELRELISVLIDGALVRSGFDVHDSNEFFVRVDQVLRRALGVSPAVATVAEVKPAPPVDPEMPMETPDEIPQFNEQISLDVDEESETVHDEL